MRLTTEISGPRNFFSKMSKTNFSFIRKRTKILLNFLKLVNQ